MNKRTKIIFTVIAVLLLGVLIWIGYSSLSNRATELNWSQFNQYVLNGNTDGGNGEESDDGGSVGSMEDKEEELKWIVHVEINNYNVYGYRPVSDGNGGYKRDVDGFYEYEKNYTYFTVMKYGDNNSASYLDAWQAVDGFSIGYEDPNSGSIWSSVISTLGILIICVVFWIIISRTAGGGGKAMSFGKTKAKVTTNIKVRFSDVAGADEEKAELQEIVEFLKNPQKFSNLGARIPKGVLLEGPPGTGKTLFAKAVAGEAGVPFFSVSGSDFVEMYVGVGASRVRDLFEIAKRNQPCIIFIDEIDAVGRERGAGLGGGSDEREQTLNQILVQMDGFEANEAIIVMAATNRSDILDPALMRPGRFDRKIIVSLPDVKGREAILRVHARNKPLEKNVNFKTVARMTSGFSGADLENLLNEAAILAARAGKKLIGNIELYEGINKVLMGPQKKSYVVTESDKRCTAYHESGHAIIAQVCPLCDPVQEVSIIPRGNAAGYTMTRPDTDDKDISKNKLNDMLCMMLGGRVAEELVIKDVTTGASNDLQRVSNIVRKMVTEWGMSDRLGLISYGDGEPIFIGRQVGKTQEYSDTTASIIDEEVRKIISAAHERAVKILTENRSVLDNMARLLVECETIYSEEVTMLVKGATAQEVMDYMNKQDNAAPENPFARFEASFKEDKPLNEESFRSAQQDERTSEEKQKETSDQNDGEGNDNDNDNDGDAFKF